MRNASKELTLKVGILEMSAKNLKADEAKTFYKYALGFAAIAWADDILRVIIYGIERFM